MRSARSAPPVAPRAARGEGESIGYLKYLYQLDRDPADGGYTPYQFIPINMSMDRSFGRRESVLVIPGLDSVLDAYGRLPGPMDRRDLTFAFRTMTGGDNDAAYDALAAWLAPGTPIRLVFQTDQGGLWYTTASNPHLTLTETSAANWGEDGYSDFTITWRIRPDWRLRYSETAERFLGATTFAFDHHETFGSRGTTTIAANPQTFLVDARGTAGLDLPTIPDTGPTVTISGPAGGDGGMKVTNTNVLYTDRNGAQQVQQFTIPFKLPTADDSVTLKFAAGSFMHTSSAFRPTKPDYQPEYFTIQPGIQNTCQLIPLGTNPLTGGHVTVDFWRRRA